jgi:hypothetical protein
MAFGQLSSLASALEQPNSFCRWLHVVGAVARKDGSHGTGDARLMSYKGGRYWILEWPGSGGAVGGGFRRAEQHGFRAVDLLGRYAGARGPTAGSGILAESGLTDRGLAVWSALQVVGAGLSTPVLCACSALDTLFYFHLSSALCLLCVDGDGYWWWQSTEDKAVRWVVPQWEVLAADRGGWRAGLKGLRVNESEVDVC